MRSPELSTGADSRPILVCNVQLPTYSFPFELGLDLLEEPEGVIGLSGDAGESRFAGDERSLDVAPTEVLHDGTFHGGVESVRRTEEKLNEGDTKHSWGMGRRQVAV